MRGARGSGGQPAPLRSPAAKRRAEAERRKRVAVTTDWEELMALADADSVRAYLMKERYTKGDVISHKAFGLGIVIREVDPGKIQVSFKDGVKLLVCNWP
ncbi:MAG: hypothetical protein FJY75_11205 [Candidatus Eisenbacteria bacterium]|uniref:Uncharacterized protein n=1 Tax=Eiseniibacteriota bacterium TaxID=2212470 RepID=A0A938BRK5_UNCEI|nr:hypothetical protein [Candidatus Eisenbacteria bacterium]